MNENINEEMRKFIGEWRLETEHYQNIGGTFVDVDSPEEKRKCDDAFKKSLEALKNNDTESKEMSNNVVNHPKHKTDTWPEPQPLPNELPAVEPFDCDLLPDMFRPWVEDIAERMQCPPDFPAVAAMVTLAGLTGKQIGIRPKQRDDWTVIPNLWGAVIGRPGKLKTPAIEEPMKPLYQLEIEAKGIYDRAMQGFEADKWVAAEREKVKSGEIRKALKAKDGTANSIAKEAISKAMQEPTRKRYVVNDPTVEKLGVLLNENPNGLLLFRDELTGWLRILDKDGHENDRTFYLESWNGNGRYVYDRIGRGTTDIEHACISILGGIQPQMLVDYMRTAPDDGLMQRFQLLVWPDDNGAWVNIDRYPNTDAKNAAYTVYQRLAEIDWQEVGAQKDGDGIPFIRFNGDAQELFTEWRTELEGRLRNPDLPPSFETHLSKYRSLVPSLALLAHLADDNIGPVKLYALERAILWSEYLESHAKRIYAPMMAPGMVSARALARRLKAGDLGTEFALRDVYRPCWSYLTKQEDALSAVNVLIDFDWLKDEREQTTGRTRTTYYVNPRIKELAS